MADTLTSSSLTDAEGGQECIHVANALDITWLQTHGHRPLTVENIRATTCDVSCVIISKIFLN